MPDQPPIAVVNVSSVVSDDEIRHYVAAIQQFMPKFCDAWGLGHIDVGFVPKDGGAPLTGMRRHLIADDSDQVGALGYHEDDPDGFPIGYTFAATDRRYGSSISCTLFHEIAEAAVNPFIDKVVALADGRVFLYENCDAVEADENAIVITMPGGPNVLLSDFVLPSYFNAAGIEGDYYDFNKKLTKPIPAMLPGGYLAYRNADGTWGQIDAMMQPARRAQVRPHVLSRRYRGMFRTWQRSTAV